MSCKNLLYFLPKFRVTRSCVTGMPFCRDVCFFCEGGSIGIFRKFVGAGVDDRRCRAKIGCIFCQSAELRVRASQICHFCREVCFFCEGGSIGILKKFVEAGVGDRRYRAKIDCIFCQSTELRVHALQAFYFCREVYFFCEGGR